MNNLFSGKKGKALGFGIFIVVIILTAGVYQHNYTEKEMFYREAQEIRLDFLKAKQTVYNSVKKTRFNRQAIQAMTSESQYKESINAMGNAIERFVALCEKFNAIALDIETMEKQVANAEEISDYSTSLDYSPEVMQSFLECQIIDDQDNINTLTDWLSNSRFPQGYNYEDKMIVFQ